MGKNEIEKINNLTDPREQNLLADLYKDVIKEAESDLELIRSSLKDLVVNILKEQPDVIVFLDKGARMFGTPVKKYLQELNLPKMPGIVFLNDENLKTAYTNRTLLNESLIENNVGYLANKKVFFVDETMSDGEGAATLKMIKDCRQGFDNIFYFALSYAGNGGADYDDGHHQMMLEKIKNDKNFKIHFDIVSNQLFSHAWSNLYVHDAGIRGSIYTRHNTDYRNKNRKNENDFKLEFQTVAEIKKRILATLRSLEISKTAGN
ncbi:MAG: hypothetical protein WC831_04960 [Parcubacteria group bacterium]|jgi:hypothetical protein